MSSVKQAICPQRIRCLPAQFSWVDQRLVRDNHLSRVNAHAAALYLFLITVADCRGLSWYGDVAAARCLSMDKVRLHTARGDLVCAGLIAYQSGLYQVLSLDNPLPKPVLQPAAAHSNDLQRGRPDAGCATVRQHLDTLHAALRRRS